MASKKFAAPVSERRLAANHANAQKSTGPKTIAGKAKSSLNAVKTGLTGHTVLLPTDDAKAYQSHVERYREEFEPQGMLQEQIVQTLADLQWRLNRIPGLETGILALARRRCAPDLFADEPDSQVRAVLLDAHVQETAARQLDNLHRQENRLRREYRQQMQELERLQNEHEKGRVDKTFQRWYAARKALLATEEETEYFEQQLADWITVKYPYGFVLSNGKIIRNEPERK
ncbi:MAG: hypothetical protein ACJ73N_02045 [Bryobacteraceae bacterium]